jgi:hypothetical protein
MSVPAPLVVPRGVPFGRAAVISPVRSNVTTTVRVSADLALAVVFAPAMGARARRHTPSALAATAVNVRIDIPRGYHRSWPTCQAGLRLGNRSR